MTMPRQIKKPKVARLPGDFCCCDLTRGQAPCEVAKLSLARLRAKLGSAPG